MNTLKQTWKYIPFVGGLICIFCDIDFYHKNKWWYVPFHYVSGLVLCTYILVKSGLL